MSLQFVLYNSKIYDDIEKWNTDLGPIDFWLRFNIKSLFGYPYVAYQVAGVSDNEGKFRDYSNYFQKSENLLRGASIHFFGPLLTEKNESEAALK